MRKKIKKLNYNKAIQQLLDKQDKLIKSVPKKYRSFTQQALNAEYVLTMIEEGHEAETYENEILDILNF